jgi:hypothetical protein
MEECDPNAKRSLMYGRLLKEKKKTGIRDVWTPVKREEDDWRSTFT